MARLFFVASIIASVLFVVYAAPQETTQAPYPGQATPEQCKEWKKQCEGQSTPAPPPGQGGYQPPPQNGTMTPEQSCAAFHQMCGGVQMPGNYSSVPTYAPPPSG